MDFNYLWIDPGVMSIDKLMGVDEPPCYEVETDTYGHGRVTMLRGPFKGEVYTLNGVDPDDIEVHLTEILGPGWKGE